MHVFRLTPSDGRDFNPTKLFSVFSVLSVVQDFDFDSDLI